ncbi:MAG: hypothetical protein ACFFCF_07930 [Promethearchaeota archaeon]
MELGTTSAIITFAIKLNEQSQVIYNQVMEASDNMQLLEAIHAMQKRQSKRTKRLHRFRRELVTEMILEPIHGFNREDFSIDMKISPDMTVAELVSVLLMNEENMKNYLTTAAEKLDFLPELSDQLQMLSDDLENNIQLLKGFQ